MGRMKGQNLELQQGSEVRTFRYLAEAAKFLKVAASFARYKFKAEGECNGWTMRWVPRTNGAKPAAVHPAPAALAVRKIERATPEKVKVRTSEPGRLGEPRMHSLFNELAGIAAAGLRAEELTVTLEDGKTTLAMKHVEFVRT